MPKPNIRPIKKQGGSIQADRALTTKLNNKKEFMRITRIMLVGIALIVLGITAFAYQGVAMQAVPEGQNIWRLPPIVATAMLLAAGIVMVAAEARAMWLKVQPGRKK